MRILVTGALGRLGSQLVKILSTSQEVTGVDIPDFDLADFNATRAYVTQYRPDLVIHPAAWTDVDGCARDPERAIQINGFGTQHIALATAEIGAAMVYVSTNEVFDGALRRSYYEYDLQNPTNPYGYSKFVGERAVISLNPRHYIVRTAWLFAHGGKNFIQSILAAAATGKTLRVVTDEVANPTYNDDLAEAIEALITTGRYGIYHFVNQGTCSRYTFARYALDHAGYANTPLTPITRHEWQRLSTPPMYCSLSNLAGAQIGIQLRPWQTAVDAFLAKEQLLQVSK
ncbi:MAG TPA: dTDP-4-dehydrorhamnose reductase [Phototrophicaceae bacterium]|jgi:dTDP-4-dehydrorhamnose reductase|nr:dTDP-4-dehydrorhamnose reductase [Phototrophicaceae bacterium]